MRGEGRNHESPPQPGTLPTIVEFFREKWFFILLLNAFWITVFYWDSLDGRMDMNRGMAADQFFQLIIPLFIIINVPYFVLVYFYPTYIEGVKSELKRELSENNPNGTGNPADEGEET